ncbi:MAG: hypothetical protein U9P49_03610 [Thermodesulfobacteriota bacterium]|nr:hypothetical protein [Thermodesulfobacteriota bacterium]
MSVCLKSCILKRRMYGRLTGKPGVLVGQGLWIGTSGGYGIVESYMSGVMMLILTEISDYGKQPRVNSE